MKIPRIVNAMGHIDDDLVASANENGRKKNPRWIKWSCIAASVVAVIIACVIIFPHILKDDSSKNKNSDSRYKDFHIQTSELGIVWPWKYKTINEKYTSIDVNSMKYCNRMSEISSDYIDEFIGLFEAAGYEEVSDVIHNEDFEAYKIKNISPERLIAVKMEDSYYVFISEDYNSPETFGEVLESYALAKSVKLERFSLQGNGIENNYYALQDDAYIWDVLNRCTDAPKTDPLGWHETEREYISFTMTSEVLGVYKRVMYVTEDGYVWTNIFDSEYLYFIGEDNAGEIIRYAKENSTEAESEPFMNTVIGEAIEITDEYIMIDDSDLCKNPSDGISYKILIKDMRISRYVENDMVKLNEFIQVTYKGEVNESDNSIGQAVSIAEVIISENNMFIPE